MKSDSVSDRPFIRRLMPVAIFIYDDNIPVDQMGFITEPKAWRKIVENAEAFYAQHTEDEILEYNRDRLDNKRYYPEHLTANTVRKQRKKTKGYIYLIKEVNGIHYKIGRTKNLKNRAKLYGVKLPFVVEITHSFVADDYEKAESDIHLEYKDKRVQGEWFALDSYDVEDICRITHYANNEFIEEE